MEYSISISNERIPTYTEEDAALIALKNDVLTSELEACESENLRLRRIITRVYQRQNRIYNIGIEKYRSSDSTLEHVCYFMAGAVFSGALTMALVVFGAI